NRRIRADAQGESQDGDGGENRCVAERAQAVADVLEKLVEPDGGPDGAGVFFHARDVAEFAHGRVAGVLRGHTARDVVFGLALDEVFDLAIEVLQHALATAHDFPPSRAGRRMRAMAPAKASHLLVSMASWRLPFDVRL